jgi:hypothetical protein
LAVEPESQEDVEIVVIRQATTKKTGFHTDLNAAAGVLEHALKEARRILAEKHVN